MNLQYQLSNGMWFDGSRRADEFIGYAAAYTGKGRDEIIAELNAGGVIKHGNDWYAKIRIVPQSAAAAPRPARHAPCICCGETDPSRFTTIANGPHCDDCV